MEERSGAIGGLGLAILVGVQAFFLGHSCASKYYRNNPSEAYRVDGIEEKVAVEYVKPSQMETPQWRDIDGDGKYETTIKIDGKDYLFRFTGQGKPELSLYSLTPAKVEPAKIVTNEYSKDK